MLVWRLRAELGGHLDEEAVETVERRAERLVGVSFLLLRPMSPVGRCTTSSPGERPDASPVGIVLTTVSLRVMLLAGPGQAPGAALASRALLRTRSRRTQAGPLVVVLSGLGLNAVLGWWWAVPVAASPSRSCSSARGSRPSKGRRTGQGRHDTAMVWAWTGDGWGPSLVGLTRLGRSPAGPASRMMPQW